MRLLLDTHVFVWAMGQVSRLPAAVAEAIRNPDNDVFLSAVSVYEIEYKRDREAFLRRLPVDLLPAAEALPAEWLPIDPRHAASAARLDRDHKDPWDRLIVAQAMVEGLVLVSADATLKKFGSEILW